MHDDYGDAAAAAGEADRLTVGEDAFGLCARVASKAGFLDYNPGIAAPR